ncbi:hypothetical protein NUH86_18425 [Sphingobium sp. JS3065]|uniref:hypothetical protein n=1 Tax=Sphingobium sp. JS3065 TaxID=2970925 RepID=UPI0022652412|nr:hypothetical protein [Sphingobium sp. JS3065]UZW57559.1 hypothetical protein NUH86_18425 [Sphingobium sp. JS3065]
MASVTAAVTALIHKVSDRIHEEERKRGAAAAVEAERIRAELDEALSLNEEIETEREAAVAQAEALRGEVEEIRLREARLQGKLEALESAFAQIDRIQAAPMREMAAAEAGRDAGETLANAGESGAAKARGAPGQELADALAAVTSQPRLFDGEQPEAPVLPS